MANVESAVWPPRPRNLGRPLAGLSFRLEMPTRDLILPVAWLSYADPRFRLQASVKSRNLSKSSREDHFRA